MGAVKTIVEAMRKVTQILSHKQHPSPIACKGYLSFAQAPPHANPEAPCSPLFSVDDLDVVYQWICKLRKEYSPNSDIWRLRRDWANIKEKMLVELNDGSYQFDPLDRLEFEDGCMISLWSSRDMMALKLISQALSRAMGDHIPKSCTHIKGHGGLKKAVQETCQALPQYRYLLRSDIKGYYESIDFSILLDIIRSYITHPVLLTLIEKALHRTETRGGLFYSYDRHGLPRGSPLSPILGGIALLPLDHAMGNIRNIYYRRFQDDWLVLCKTKSALRKVIKITHRVVNALKLRLHPTKTFIGKISRGFNFLGYFMNGSEISPSRESLRRFLENAEQKLHPENGSLYEKRQETEQVAQQRRRRMRPERDVSEYAVNEPAPDDEDIRGIIAYLLRLAAHRPDKIALLHRYFGQWRSWVLSGLAAFGDLRSSLETFLPSLFATWGVGIGSTGNCPAAAC